MSPPWTDATPPVPFIDSSLLVFGSDLNRVTAVDSSLV
jgi:hypothetical protein